MEKLEIPDKLFILISTNAVVLPGAVVRLSITNDSGKAILNGILELGEKVIGVVPKEEENQLAKENDIGTAVLVLRISASTTSQKSSFILVLGLQRIVIKHFLDRKSNQRAVVDVHEDSLEDADAEVINLLESAKKILLPMFLKMGPLSVTHLKHSKILLNYYCTKTALTKHVQSSKHRFDFEDVEIVHKESITKKRKILEAIVISENNDKAVNFKTDTKNLNHFYSEILQKLK